jgi:hypothetical protein
MTGWHDLPPAEQRRIRDGSLALARLAWDYATAVVVAADGDADSDINTASGFVIELSGRPFLATAAHVITKYRDRRATTRYAYVQAGRIGIDALERIAFYNEDTDVAFIDLSGLDVSATDAVVYRPVGPWPPRRVRQGDGIQFCGFPKAYRRFSAPSEVDFSALPGFCTVTTAGDDYCTCQLEREHTIGFGGPGELPPTEGFGGLSGGPVLYFGALSYPIVGLVSQVAEAFDIVRIATLERLPDFHA